MCYFKRKRGNNNNNYKKQTVWKYDWHQIFNNQARCAHTNLSIFDEKWTNTIIFYSLLCYLKKEKSFILHRSILDRKMRETWSVAKLCLEYFFLKILLNVVCHCYKQQKLFFLFFSVYLFQMCYDLISIFVWFCFFSCVTAWSECGKIYESRLFFIYIYLLFPCLKSFYIPIKVRMYVYSFSILFIKYYIVIVNNRYRWHFIHFYYSFFPSISLTLIYVCIISYKRYRLF